MARAACFVLVVALGATPDISHLIRFSFQQGQTADPEKSAPQGTLPSPTFAPQAEKQAAQPGASSPHHAAHLSEYSRLAIIRAISGEFVRAQISLPGGKDGYHLSAAKPAPAPALVAVAASKSEPDNPFTSSHVIVPTRAPVIHPGDKVQITRIEFREKTIVLDLNGGGKQKWHLRDHVQLSVGGPMSGSMEPANQGPAGLEGQGSTLFLDFGHKLPDLSPDDLKLKLASVLDFAAQRSASAQYAESLPPEFQQAIKNGTAAVGMDREMVLAAMGRPDRKVRERDADGNDTEDWIYGNPPGRTIFVTFIGEKVSRVRQFN